MRYRTIDITARIALEKALRESETRFHSLFNSMAEGVALQKSVCECEAIKRDAADMQYTAI